MVPMYFSGKNSNGIFYDDPDNQCIQIYPSLFVELVSDGEQNTRVFLDTPLLKIRDLDQFKILPTPQHIIDKYSASVSIGTMPDLPALYYITNALVKAEFREISSDEFKRSFLEPFEMNIRGTNFIQRQLLNAYEYPRAPSNNEEWVQRYFNGRVLTPIENLYKYTCGQHHVFGGPLIIKPSFTDVKNLCFKPDIIHLLTNKLASLHEFPTIYFGLGDYKTESYYLSQGFEELKGAISSFKKILSNTRLLRAMEAPLIFEDKAEWSPRVVCALVLRKYLYQAFLCGTDRVLISDHQTFSGFFNYRIIKDEVEGDKMAIEYYIINDPETVADGITLRSAIAGFFYNNEADALKTMTSLRDLYKLRCVEQGIVQKEKGDPLRKVVPRPVERSSGRATEKLRGNQLKDELALIEESDDIHGFDEIRGNTYCRIIYDPATAFPNIGSALPSPIFVKLYNYPEIAREHFPRRQSYYNMFIDEYEINKILAHSNYASNYARLVMSGYWNGLPSHPIHMFEYLGKRKPIGDWDHNKVYHSVRARLQEIHQLRISHNDIRIDNIHVSLTGRTTLIDFGLAIYPCNEENMAQDVDSLNRLFSDYVDGNYGDKIQNGDERGKEDGVKYNEKNHNTCGHDNEVNSVRDVIFDELVTESVDTADTTKLDFNLKDQ